MSHVSSEVTGRVYTSTIGQMPAGPIPRILVCSPVEDAVEDAIDSILSGPVEMLGEGAIRAYPWLWQSSMSHSAPENNGGAEAPKIP